MVDTKHGKQHTSKQTRKNKAKTKQNTQEKKKNKISERFIYISEESAKTVTPVATAFQQNSTWHPLPEGIKKVYFSGYIYCSVSDKKLQKVDKEAIACKTQQYSRRSSAETSRSPQCFNKMS